MNANEKSRRIAGKREDEIMDEFENYLIEYFRKNDLSMRETVYLLEIATLNIKNHMARIFKWGGFNPIENHPQK